METRYLKFLLLCISVLLASCNKEMTDSYMVRYTFVNRKGDTKTSPFSDDNRTRWMQGDTLFLEIHFCKPADDEWLTLVKKEREGFIVHDGEGWALFDNGGERRSWIEIEKDPADDYIVYMHYSHPIYYYEERFGPLLSNGTGQGYGSIPPPWDLNLWELLPFTEGHHIIEVPSPEPEEAEVN